MSNGVARVSRAEWAKRVARWAASGLTAEQFGAKHGVNARTLAYWKWVLRKEAEGSSPRRDKPAEGGPGSPSFVELRPSARDTRIALELRDGRRLLVPGDFDADGLRRLLDVLEGA